MSSDPKKAQGLPVPYEVGYGKPPAEHQFQKGRSGNPYGRPKTRRKPKAPPRLLGSDEPTSSLILQEAYRSIKVREGDRVIEMTANQAVLRAMQQSALKGNRLAQRGWANLVMSIEAEQKRIQFEWFTTMFEYKRDAETEIARCQRLGIAPPEMIPHPDDIVIDINHGTAEVFGPSTPEEKRKFDKHIARRDEAQTEVLHSAAAYKRSRSPRMQQIHLDEWHYEQRMFDIINDRLPQRYQTTLQNRSWREGASRPGDFAPGSRPNWRRPK